jgi:hypothetical protein
MVVLMLERDQSRVLLIGPALWRVGERWDGRQSVLVSELPDGGADYNTTLLNWPQDKPVQAMACTGSTADAVALAAPLFRSLNAGPTLRRLGRTLWPGQAAAPLFILGRAGDTIILQSCTHKSGSVIAMRCSSGQAPPTSPANKSTPSWPVSESMQAGRSTALL